VILDEPDVRARTPVGRREVRDIILELKQAGKTVLFSTPSLPDAEMLCDPRRVIVGGSCAEWSAGRDCRNEGAAMEVFFEYRWRRSSTAVFAEEIDETGKRYRLQLRKQSCTRRFSNWAAGARLFR